MAKKADPKSEVTEPKNNNNAIVIVLSVIAGVLLLLTVILFLKLNAMDKQLSTELDRVLEARDELKEELEDKKDQPVIDDRVDDEIADDSKDVDGDKSGVISELESFHSNAFGYSFDVPAGYNVIRNLDTPEALYFDMLLERVYIEDPDVVAEYANSMEGYPIVVVRVFENPNDLSVEQWAVDNALFTNYSDAWLVDSQMTQIDGKNVLSYKWCGLVCSDVWMVPIVPSQNYILTIEAHYFEEDHPVRDDVMTIIESLNL